MKRFLPLLLDMNKTPEDFFWSTLWVPSRSAIPELQKILSQEKKVGIGPKILTLQDAVAEITQTRAPDLQKRPLPLFLKWLPLVRKTLDFLDISQAAHVTSQLLGTLNLCSRLGCSLGEVPFPLKPFGKTEQKLWNLLEECTQQEKLFPRLPFSEMQEKMRTTLLKNEKEKIFFLDFFPSASTPLWECVRTVLTAAPNGYVLPLPTEKKPSVFYEEFDSARQEAIFIAQKIKNSAASSLAVVSDDAALLSHIQAELTHQGVATQAYFAAESWSDTKESVLFLDFLTMLVQPTAFHAYRVLRLCSSRSPAWSAFLQTFFLKIVCTPSDMRDDALITPAGAALEDLCLFVSKKFKNDADFLEIFQKGVDFVCAYALPSAAPFADFVSIHQAAWLNFTTFVDISPQTAFFDALAPLSTMPGIYFAQDYIDLLPHLLKKIPVPSARFTYKTQGEKRILLLSSKQALFYAYEEAFLVGLNEGAWGSASPPTLFWNIPEAWDKTFEQDTWQGLATKPRLFLTRTKHANVLSYYFLEKMPLPAPTLWGEDAPTSPEAPVLPKARAPVEARPRSFSVTDFQLLHDDPYAFYVKRILNLFPIPPLHDGTTYAPEDFGKWAHALLHRYVKDGAYAQKINLCAFVQEKKFRPSFVEKRFVPRFAPILERLAQEFAQKREASQKILTEENLQKKICVCAEEGANSPSFVEFEIHGRADRLDISEEAVFVIDYKGGALPPESHLQKLEKLQLSLEGFMIKEQFTQNILLRMVSLRPVFKNQEELTLAFSETFYKNVEIKVENLLSNYIAEDFVFETPAA
ncbi:hypothetical protein AGMMS49949_02460 [Alphaproteobacteria bacterium]|nr:hypothetical protein AGMMS49949_02460 [Alphaproteobacteria bacterium]GHS98209.1 hypothetical protein AGMMS50296_5750 [Alphaproteobacteria bacterium]